MVRLSNPHTHLSALASVCQELLALLLPSFQIPARTRFLTILCKPAALLPNLTPLLYLSSYPIIAYLCIVGYIFICLSIYVLAPPQ